MATTPPAKITADLLLLALTLVPRSLGDALVLPLTGEPWASSTASVPTATFAAAEGGGDDVPVGCADGPALGPRHDHGVWPNVADTSHDRDFGHNVADRSQDRGFAVDACELVVPAVTPTPRSNPIVTSPWPRPGLGHTAAGTSATSSCGECKRSGHQPAGPGVGKR